jgi:hypothetical protein
MQLKPTCEPPVVDSLPPTTFAFHCVCPLPSNLSGPAFLDVLAAVFITAMLTPWGLFRAATKCNIQLQTQSQALRLHAGITLLDSHEESAVAMTWI